MNKYYISVLFLFLGISNSFSQNGISKISSADFGASFFLVNGNDVWIGKGGWAATNLRRKMGLIKYENNTRKVLTNNGIFTDGVKFNNDIFITADDGLYQYSNNDTPFIHNGLKSLSCIIEYKDSLMIGSEGNGYAVFKDGFFRTAQIQIGNLNIDTIYAIKPHGKAIYFGTSRGLIKYENNNYTLIPTPIFETNDAMFNYMQKSILSIQIDVYGKLWYCVKSTNSYSNVYLMEGSKSYRIDSLFNEKFCMNANFWPKSISKIELNDEGHVLLNCGWGILEFGNQIKTYPINKDIKMPGSSNSLVNFSSYNVFAYGNKANKIYYLLSDGVYELDKNNFNVNDFMNEIRHPYINSIENMDVNDLSATVSSDGLMYGGYDLMRFFENIPALKMKTGPCANASFSAGVWMGGLSKSDDKLYFAQQSYRSLGNDFVPGPINVNTLQYDSVLSYKYNKIWSIDKKTIDDFIANHNNSGYQIPQSILNWPGNPPANCYSKMAPYVDVDNNNIYDPSKGDYPKIKGDKMMWWMFNDLVKHEGSISEPMMIQINATCYAYSDINLNSNDSNFIVNRTLLFDYDVINLSNRDYKDVYFSLFNDVDIGNYADDYLGYDSLNNAAFAFNGDDNDNAFGNFNNFGKNPPVFVSQLLNKKMDYFVRLTAPGGSMMASNLYYSMFANSDSAQYSFYKSNYRIHHYPCQIKDSGYTPTDIRYIMTNTINNFNKGDVYNVVFSNSVVYDPNTNFLNEDCGKIKNNVLKIKSWYDNDDFPSKPYWPSEINVIETKQFKLYPNPSQNQLNVLFNLANNRSIQVFSMDSKLLLNQNVSESFITLDVSALKPGMYIIQIQDETGMKSQVFIKN
jgi:hypothetical protein